MALLREVIADAERRRVAVGHFNISDTAALRAVFEAARGLNLPVIVGVSEGEADFVGRRQAAALVKSLREEFDFPIFINADHVRSREKIKESVEAGYDAVIIDGSSLPFEENVKLTKEAVDYVRNFCANSGADIIVEGELGFIGASSRLLDELPPGAAVEKENLTKPEEAGRFVKETGVDLLAPAVGNIHGMLKAVKNPALNIERIGQIRKAAGVPLVLHGGSGLSDSDFLGAIKAGISVIHINTEIRLAWRAALDKSFKEDTGEVVPYKLLAPAFVAVKKVVESRLRLFNGQ